MKSETGISLMQKVNEKVTPVAAKIAGQRHVQAISGGIMTIIPFTLLAAIFNIINTPPVTADIIASGSTYGKIMSGWFNFAQKYGSILSVPNNMTMGLMSVIVVVAISYKLASSYHMKELSSAMIAMVVFLTVAAPAAPAYLASVLTEGTDISMAGTVNVLDTTYLGSAGLFVAIVIALLSVEVTRFCMEKNIAIRLPDAVPPAVGDSFSTVIPLLINFVIFYGISLILQGLTGYTIPQAINMVLTPAISNVNTPWAIIMIIVLGNLMWCFGIHGPSLISMLYIPVQFQIYAANYEIVSAGGEAAFQAIDMTQFANPYLGLNLVLLFMVSSKQLKAIGKASIIPGIFMINEPVIFGMPIMFNPLMLIPQLLVPIVTMLLSYIAGSIGILGGGYNILFAQLPIGLNPYFASMKVANLIFAFLMVAVQFAIWLPFVRMYDKQLLTQETERA